MLPLTPLPHDEFEILAACYGTLAAGEDQRGQTMARLVFAEGVPIALAYSSPATDGEQRCYSLRLDAPDQTQLTLVSGHLDEDTEDVVMLVEGEAPEGVFTEYLWAKSQIEPSEREGNPVSIVVKKPLTTCVITRIGTPVNRALLSLNGYVQRLEAQWPNGESVDMEEAKRLVERLKSPELNSVVFLFAPIIEYTDRHNEWDSGEVVTWPHKVACWIEPLL